MGNVAAPFHLGRTASHEIGHWLNLKHLNDGSNGCVDDLVGDTPREQAIHQATNCPTYPELTGRCDATDPSTMFMNFMEYVPDDCMNLFTNGQRIRSRGLFATVNGIPAPRVSQLNNFFGFAGQLTSITCKGKITVSPICLPVTWTVTGPATITSGAGTNQIELTATGTGTVHLVATSGNYTAETDINATVIAAPDNNSLIAYFNTGTTSSNLQDNNCLKTYNFPGMYSGTIDLSDSRATSYTWSLVSKYPNTVTTGIGPNNDPQHQNVYVKPKDGRATYRLTRSNACGSASHDYTFIADGLCLPEVDVVDPGGDALLASPNPTTGDLTLSLTTEKKDKSIKEVIIQSKTGREVKRVRLNSNLKSQTINISELPPDVYLIQIYDGENWISKKIIKQ